MNDNIYATAKPDIQILDPLSTAKPDIQILDPLSTAKPDINTSPIMTDFLAHGSGSQQTFNASQFESLIVRLGSIQNSIVNNILSIVRNCAWSSNSYASEDSGLSASYQGLANSFGKASEKANEFFGKLTAEIKRYMTETIENEKSAVSDLENINTQLDAAISAMDAL